MVAPSIEIESLELQQSKAPKEKDYSEEIRKIKINKDDLKKRVRQMLSEKNLPTYFVE